jgi:hypothetical protein
MARLRGDAAELWDVGDFSYFGKYNMSQLQSSAILFVILLALTAFCSYLGDDDVVYNFLDRKPTPREGFIRVRWVLLKAITSICGGAVLAVGGMELIRLFCPLNLSKNEDVLLRALGMGVVSLLIGVLQNEIRRLRGRPRRPVFDWSILNHNLKQRLGK